MAIGLDHDSPLCQQWVQNSRVTHNAEKFPFLGTFANSLSAITAKGDPEKMALPKETSHLQQTGWAAKGLGTWGKGAGMLLTHKVGQLFLQVTEDRLSSWSQVYFSASTTVWRVCWERGAVLHEGLLLSWLGLCRCGPRQHPPFPLIIWQEGAEMLLL